MNNKTKNKMESTNNHYTVEMLCQYHDEAFIENTYQCILNRQPDKQVKHQKLTELRSGLLSKERMVSVIRYSPEGRRKNIPIIGVRAFYLLNKLAKLGNVEFIAGVTIKLEARTSQRVPFGTGPAVQKILDLQESKQAYCYYHPEVFSLLKSTLHAFLELWQYRADIVVWLNNQPLLVQSALTEIGFNTFVAKQKNNSEKQFNKQLIVWFDAFKTLKFIHSLRENHYQDIPLTEALLKAHLSSKIPNLTSTHYPLN
mgnify:CR=1 FL=1